MKKIRIEQKDLIIFIIIFIFSLLILENYLINHFAADTFNIFQMGYQNYAINYSFLDGRVFMGVIGLIVNLFDIPITAYSSIMMFLAIFTSCIVVIVLKNIVLKYKKVNTKWEMALITIICYYTIFHFLYIENLYFVEGFVMAVSLLLYILAANFLVESKKHNFIITLILLFAGLMAYQATISMFFACVILFSMLKRCNCKEIIKNFIKAICIGIIAVILNNFEIIAVERIFNIHSNRGLDLRNMSFRIYIIYRKFFNIVRTTSKVFPKDLYLAFLTLIFIEFIVKVIKKDKSEKKLLIEQLVLAIMCIALSFIPSLASLSVFTSARIRFTIGATIGILFIHLFVKTDISEGKTIISKLLILTFLIYAIINSLNYIYLTGLNKKANELDEKNVYEMNKYIENYETTTNSKIKYVGVVIMPNDVKKAYYEEIDPNCVGIAISAIRTEWTTTGIINYYTNRNLEKKDVSLEEEENYLMNVDNSLDYLCMGDTLYITVYMY